MKGIIAAKFILMKELFWEMFYFLDWTKEVNDKDDEGSDD